MAATNTYTSTTLSIGGSTLLAPLMSDWVSTTLPATQSFVTHTGGVVQVNYQAVGSTTGTDDALDTVFSLGFSDAPIPANGLATLNGAGDVTSPASSPPNATLSALDPLVQIPDAIAPVSIFYEIPGFTGHLNLTGAIIAQIYLEQIVKWNNPLILALNPGLTTAQKADLAAHPISPVHRSDGSGTSFNLTYYFCQVDDANWTGAGYKCGSTSASNFPGTELSAKGTGGVAGLVAATNGAIGYGELSYAIGAGLAYAAVENQAGNFILPSSTTAANAAAADSSEIEAGNGVYTPTNAPGADSYPITALTYVFVYQNQDLGTSGGSTWTRGDAYDVVQFLGWIVTQGQTDAAALTYAPLPASVQEIDLGLIAQINYNGHAILPSTTTSVSCNHSSVTVGKTTVKCTATVTGASPTGYVSWMSSAAGTFTSAGSCKVSRHGTCTISYSTAAVSASNTISAAYTGDLNNLPSVGTAAIAVTIRAPTVSVSCSPGSVATGSSATCTAVVTGFSPTGTVSFTQSGVGSVTFTTASCTLGVVAHNSARCSVTVTGATAGGVKISGAYNGDSNNSPVTKTHNLKVTA